jgi:hypothetical protein
MNQRLKLLAEQADFALYEDGNFRSDPGHWINEELEKFAKLIIQECCDQVREIDAMEIRKHFGITTKHHAAAEWPREL